MVPISIRFTNYLFLLIYIANDQPIEENDNTNPDTAFADGWSGNKRRKLWKTTCTRAALNVCLFLFIL